MAVVAALASLTVGVAVAWLLARKRFPGKALLDALVHLPLVLPPVVMGYALLVMFGNQGPLGRWLHDTLGITLAYSIPSYKTPWIAVNMLLPLALLKKRPNSTLS